VWGVANIARTVETEALVGLVERVTFHIPDNGFCVLRINARGQRELTTLVRGVGLVYATRLVRAFRGDGCDFVEQ
jgi:exodeoxyribonuclease V alpha subunit